MVSSVILDNRSLTVAAQNQRFRAARVSERYPGQDTRFASCPAPVRREILDKENDIWEWQ